MLGTFFEILKNGEINKLLNVKIDGKVLDTSNYTLESGSTIFTLKSSYMDTLEPAPALPL